MKYIYSLPFILMGVLFLVISTVFYMPLREFLLNLQSQSNLNAPQFWDLSLVLTIVRIIFIIVGAFLTLFGIAIFLIKNRRT